MKYGFVIDGLRVLSRGIIIIDKEDIVKHVEYVSEITSQPDYEKALSILTSLK